MSIPPCEPPERGDDPWPRLVRGEYTHTSWVEEYADGTMGVGVSVDQRLVEEGEMVGISWVMNLS